MKRGLGLAAALTSALFLAACGGAGSGTTSGFPRGKEVKGKKGGTLTVLSNGDVDYIDPGSAYYQFTYILTYPTQRPLYSYSPTEVSKAVPDLAASDPQISDGGKTVTVKLRRGVRFSPPVNRGVTPKDVKYAIDRGFNPTVANGYASTDFANA